MKLNTKRASTKRAHSWREKKVRPRLLFWTSRESSSHPFTMTRWATREKGKKITFCSPTLDISILLFLLFNVDLFACWLFTIVRPALDSKIDHATSYNCLSPIISVRSVVLSACVSVGVSACLSVYLPACLSVCLSLCLQPSVIIFHCECLCY